MNPHAAPASPATPFIGIERPASRPIRHTLTVRLSHWVVAIASILLLVTGVEILISHPRFYWGEEGNVNTPPLFQIPIPASRSSVPTRYAYTLPDQNGWSRSLHFQSAWILVLAGMAYSLHGIFTGHWRRSLIPKPSQLAPSNLARELAWQFKPEADEHTTTYNPIQQLTYLAVILAIFPLMIWTGLAMSPAITSACPFLVEVLGGHQSARTLHFLATILLTLFVLVHVGMVLRHGFRRRMRTMILGQ